jgi:hypothetical protein
MSVETQVEPREATGQESEPIEAIIKRMLPHLGGLGKKATVELRLIPAGGSGAASVHSVILSPAGAFLHPHRVKKPTLVAISTPEAFSRMAEGSYSLVQAYLDGELKVHGNVDLGKEIVRNLPGPANTPPLVCPTLYNENYKLEEPGFPVGSLTFSGEFFTPFGEVEIVYDYGSGFYQQIVMANSSGTFTTTEIGIYCGPIPGRGNVGVVVTATDLATGKYTTQGYVTPCS